jgi:putative transposase
VLYEWSELWRDWDAIIWQASQEHIKGRKRFILVDTLRLLLKVIVTEANCPERLGGAAVVMEATDAAENLVVIWVDQGFDGSNFQRVIKQLCAATVDVICRTEPGFHVLPFRWIVERTFGWWNQYRRLSKDYELLPEMSESIIYTVMIRLMLKRLVKSQSRANASKFYKSLLTNILAYVSDGRMGFIVELIFSIGRSSARNKTKYTINK